MAEFWLPFQPESECDLRRSCHGLYGVGRLKAGVTVDAALANFVSIATQLQRQYPDTNRDQGANVKPLTEVIVGDIRPILIVLMTGAGLLLLIATVDVVGLLLVSLLLLAEIVGPYITPWPYQIQDTDAILANGLQPVPPFKKA